MDEQAFVGVAEISTSLLSRLEAKSGDAIHVSLSTEGEYSGLTSCVVQAVSSSSSASSNDVLLHPLLLEFLSLASETECELNEEEISSDDEHVSLGSMPTISAGVSPESESPPRPWVVSKVSLKESMEGVHLVLKCMYADPKLSSCSESDFHRAIAASLEGRIIMQGAVSLLATIEGYAVVLVSDCAQSDENLVPSMAYKLGGPDTFSVRVARPEGADVTELVYAQTWEQDCPGYESIVEEILQLLCLQNSAAPSGLLLTGCAGVGKTRLCSHLAGKLSSQRWAVHWVSTQTLMLQASSASEDDMLGVILPPDSHSKAIVIFDDLHVLAEDGSAEPTSIDSERKLVLACLIQAVDRLVQRAIPLLGVSQKASDLPSDLVKAGRFEKELSMDAPTEQQRERILFEVLKRVTVDEEKCELWANLLASVTAGCVAVDLRRLCVDSLARVWARSGDESAATTWEDLREAARTIIPSQLALLDVVKPPSLMDECSLDDWSGIHERSWRGFAGYSATKKRIYRTVVVPWRRLLDAKLQLDNKTLAIAPPTGVLFHGHSGCGKTFAATCLASSLCLPVIKVRASDVLDKWLGGSEAVVRSIFARARAAAPSVLLFDEIDAIAGNRANDGESTDVMSRLLSTLLNEMDGVSSSRQANVLVIACTNRLESLDTALLRPGRLEEHIILHRPSVVDAEQILQLGLIRAPLDESVDLNAVAKELVSRGASGADILGLSREVVLRALRLATASREVRVSSQDFEDSIGN